MFGVILEALKHYVYQYWSLDSINKFGKPDMVPVPGQPDKTQARLEAKGIEMVRRDNFMLMSDGMERKVRKILCDRDPVGAFVELQQELDDLRAGHTDPAQLIVSKSLSRAPRDYTVKAAHVNLAIRLEERNPDTAPRCGDRVRMVYRQGGPKDKISDLGEDPMYALKNNIPLNTKHYIDAYRKPMERLLETIMPGIVSRIFDDKPLQTDKRVQGTLFGSKKAEAPHATTAGKDDTPDRPISRGSQLTLDWARKMSKLNVGDVDKRLNEARLRYQNGTRTRNIVQIASQTAFGKRLLISETCLMCNTPVEDNRAVCVRCKEKQAQKVQTLRERTKQQREQYLAQKTQLWDKCRGCAGSDAAAKLCDNDGCASFFARDLAVIEYERTEKQMARFSLLDIL